MQLCNKGVRIMLGGDLNALGGFKDQLFEYGAVFTKAENKEATMFCYVLFRLAEHQVALAAKDLTGDQLMAAIHCKSIGTSIWHTRQYLLLMRSLGFLHKSSRLFPS